ncbi:Protein of unknown function [Pseudomonas mohnii]|uniref:DUF1120 domain-containing protein n=1 Tax=Pseudomonas mohnii TaxID=395600 RepID=A0ABY0XWK5_9PSED|nr:DUF1120 domain-containing protein [Pseudomonas mohnii]SEC39460.1 Protein of unknown function [Pseudomonas mohnii]
MKQYFIALSTAALVSVAPFALASSTDLTVTGVITPAACTPTLSNGGVVDNGKISAKDLDQVRETLVGTHPLQLSVSCDGPTQFALKPVDHQAGTAALTSWFGLGLTSAGEKLGWVRVNVKNAVADGVAAQAIDSDDVGKTWKATWVTSPGYLLSVGSTTDVSIPLFVKDLTMDFEVNTNIARADSLTLTDEVVMDGAVTFEMTYL